MAQKTPEFKGNSIEELVEDAKSQGFYAVDQDLAKQEVVYDEWKTACAEATRLCAVEDPMETPYLSKYKARDVLDQVVNKLEATKAIASLEQRKEQIQQLNWRIASCRVRVGTISWEVDEPHNAQTDLELGASYFSPDFVEDVNLLVGEEPESEEGGEEEEKPLDPDFIKALVPPAIQLPPAAKVVDALKCLNMLGILWAGRGVVAKSLVYLRASKQLYMDHIGKFVIAKGKGWQEEKDEMESCYTHNLFYLAQAYGHLGDTMQSSEYCKETLQRQLAGGFGDGKTSAVDWVKNCLGISDFYMAMGQFKKSCAALLSARKVIANEQEQEKEKEKEREGEESVWPEQAADLSRRLANVDLVLFKRGFEMTLAIQEARLYVILSIYCSSFLSLSLSLYYCLAAFSDTT
jgi:hypothetical protein